MEKLLHPDADTWPDSLADFASKTVVMGDDYDSRDDLWKSYQLCMAAIRERMAAGGPSWTPKAASDEKNTPPRQFPIK